MGPFAAESLSFIFLSVFVTQWLSGYSLLFSYHDNASDYECITA